MRQLLLLLWILAWAGSFSGALAATELGPNRFALPGLVEVVTGPERNGPPLRLGFHLESGSLDPAHGIQNSGFSDTYSSRLLRFQLEVRASRNVMVGVTIPLQGIEGGGESFSGWGDLQIGLSGRLLEIGSSHWGAYTVMRLPTGDSAKGLSTGEMEGELGLHGRLEFFEKSLRPTLRWHLNAGYRTNKNDIDGHGILGGGSLSDSGLFPPVYPPTSAMESSDTNDEILLRTALEFRQRWGHLFLEASLDWLSGHPHSSFQESASWITPGIYMGNDGGFGLKAAWSILLTADDADTSYEPFLPDWIVHVGVSYPLFFGGRDRDGDGIADKHDLCPTIAEDLDSHEDGDGCPDPDNDGDGIEDRLDLAPNLPEDFDGYQDADGRPELDNDLDGIPDDQDLCPLKPEDFDGFEDEDGCPDIFEDLDGDGIEDSEDSCPQEAEDFDGFEDADGCPELDNDLDGIPDAEDLCPLERENYNGVEDDDGCPDEI